MSCITNTYQQSKSGRSGVVTTSPVGLDLGLGQAHLGLESKCDYWEFREFEQANWWQINLQIISGSLWWKDIIVYNQSYCQNRGLKL
ncbi:unnamed protein product [Oppiella nova]|uniref:Uncharacterized protein n=1 Tax=Oppiella nova TaxID=334625 RepID=A0A7R9LN39_9ACAR|nr:unnamed protein product [Oppiella nova]CAG2165290.1 unnamed protein product [Oppiella nova]